MLTSSFTGRDRRTDWLNWQLELGKMKKVGTFLNGCKIFLSGLTEAEQVRRLTSLFYVTTS